MSLLFFSFIFQKKKKNRGGGVGGKGCRFLLFSYIASQISYVCFTNVAVLDALIIFAFI
jgi:hypothetical protein